MQMHEWTSFRWEKTIVQKNDVKQKINNDIEQQPKTPQLAHTLDNPDNNDYKNNCNYLTSQQLKEIDELFKSQDFQKENDKQAVQQKIPIQEVSSYILNSATLKELDDLFGGESNQNINNAQSCMAEINTKENQKPKSNQSQKKQNKHTPTSF